MILDKCWFVILPQNRGIVYTTPSQNAHEAWEKATKVVTTDGVRAPFMGKG